MTHGEAGKGDGTRPFNREKWSAGYDRAFGSNPNVIVDKKLLQRLRRAYKATKFKAPEGADAEQALEFLRQNNSPEVMDAIEGAANDKPKG